jgi:Flp pilus assembly protein protease CpaA
MIEALSSVLLVGTAIYISFTDIVSHRIPNRSLLLLIIALTNQMNQTPLEMTALVLLLIWGAGLLARVGMGDLKLLSILTTLQGQILVNPIAWIFFSVVAALSILIHVGVRRSFQGDIALAPAILIPFISLYLAF